MVLSTIYRLILLCLILSIHTISRGQLTDPAWYDQSEYEQVLRQKQVREHRAKRNIKSIAITDEIRNITSEEEYDREGRTLFFLSHHKSSQRFLSKEFIDKKLKNKWKYDYDQHGNLVKVKNDHESIAGTTFGGEKPFSDPGIGPPWKLTSIHLKKEFEYVYDDKGNIIEQHGEVHREPYKYHRTNAYRVYEESSRTDWRYVYEYDSLQKPVRRIEYRNDIDQPVFIRTFDHDNSGKVVKETVYSGENIVKIFSFKYDDKGRMIERNNEQAKKRFLFSYDSSGNLVKIELYRREGKLTLTMNYSYNEQGLLISKSYNGMRINQTQENATYKYELDDQGRVVKKIKTVTGAEPGRVVYEYSYY